MHLNPASVAQGVSVIPVAEDSFRILRAAAIDHIPAAIPPDTMPDLQIVPASARLPVSLPVLLGTLRREVDDAMA